MGRMAEMDVGGLLCVEEHRWPGAEQPGRLRRSAERRLDGLEASGAMR